MQIKQWPVFTDGLTNASLLDYTTHNTCASMKSIMKNHYIYSVVKKSNDKCVRTASDPCPSAIGLGVHHSILSSAEYYMYHVYSTYYNSYFHFVLVTDMNGFVAIIT